MGYVSKSLKLSALCMAITFVNSQAFAIDNLEKLDDYELADSTGEGIALLPENFSFRFNGADTANNGAGTYGAGAIRLIPVGPVSTEMKNKGYEKADIYINGVSLAQSKKDYGVAKTGDDWGVPFGALGTGVNDFGREIGSWGSANNPWVFKTLTENAPNFVGNSNPMPYLSFEAPLMHNIIPTIGGESSAYNLKLGMYVDAFKRNSDIAENGYAGLSNRVRLAVVWDGFSVNGSKLNVFRTQGGVTSNMGGTYNASLKVNNVMETHTFKYGLDTSYNETFGVSGVIRLNSGYTNTSRAVVDFTGNVTRNIYQLDFQRVTPSNANSRVLRDAAGNVLWVQGENVTSSPNTSSGILQTYTPPTRDMKLTDVYNGIPTSGTFPNFGMCLAGGGNVGNTGIENNMQCYSKEGITARRFVATRTNNWTPPTVKSVLRISTQELLNSMPSGIPNTNNGTPLLGGLEGYIPNFKPNSSAEGIFLYDANINLVLGSLNQPLILNTDGNNFSLELTRIPNSANVYQKIYQKYSDTDSTTSGTYLGNTCNIHQCGGTLNLAGVAYQDSTATHSSISIGSTVYDQATNKLSAYTGIESYGVSIGALTTGTGLTSSNVQDYTQVWRIARTATGPNVQYASSGCGVLGLRSCSASSFVDSGSWQAVAPKNPTNLNPNAYESVYRQNTNGQILGIHTTMPTNPTNHLNSMNPGGATVSNNFGSVAIDGLLIQHFKFTTTGL